MSDITIIIVCCLIILAGWLLRKYQDGELGRFSQKNKKPSKNTSTNSKLSKKNNSSLTQVLAEAFPEHVIKDKVDDPYTAFVCDKEGQIELAIVKLVTNAEKKVQSMGGIVRVTYGAMPSVKTLQQDLAVNLSKPRMM